MGKLIEWYKPQKKRGKSTKTSVTGPPAKDGVQPVEKGEYVRPRDILQAALENEASIDKCVLLIVDQDGNLGLVSNLDGAAENLMFLEGAKQKIVASQYDTSGFTSTGPEDAS